MDNEIKPHFKAKTTVTRGRKYGPDKGKFTFGEDGWRVIPTQIDGMQELYGEMARGSLGIYVGKESVFEKGESFDAECRYAVLEAYTSLIKLGAEFKLWDGGFFAVGVITEVYKENWIEI
ncbi:hypothetical protein [Candidatus Uabimicrobium sp. HlEnr_7]|uniref:hypothetical protein n=1 Tax=Candidatus Uabimicrobium helgolandensis TaxID=3095367 RepID=UPI0035575D6B